MNRTFFISIIVVAGLIGLTVWHLAKNKQGPSKEEIIKREGNPAALARYVRLEKDSNGVEVLNLEGLSEYNAGDTTNLKGKMLIYPQSKGLKFEVQQFFKESQRDGFTGWTWYNAREIGGENLVAWLIADGGKTQLFEYTNLMLSASRNSIWN